MTYRHSLLQAACPCSRSLGLSAGIILPKPTVHATQCLFPLRYTSTTGLPAQSAPVGRSACTPICKASWECFKPPEKGVEAVPLCVDCVASQTHRGLRRVVFSSWRKKECNRTFPACPPPCALLEDLQGKCKMEVWGRKVTGPFHVPTTPTHRGWMTPPKGFKPPGPIAKPGHPTRALGPHDHPLR